MSSHLYLLNNLIGIKNHILDYIISCKIFFQQKVTLFKGNMNL